MGRSNPPPPRPSPPQPPRPNREMGASFLLPLSVSSRFWLSLGAFALEDGLWASPLQAAIFCVQMAGLIGWGSSISSILNALDSVVSPPWKSMAQRRVLLLLGLPRLCWMGFGSRLTPLPTSGWPEHSALGPGPRFPARWL